MKIKKQFLKDESGVATIEWLAISAVVLVAAITISLAVLQGANTLGTAVAGEMSATAEDISGGDGDGGGGG